MARFFLRLVGLEPAGVKGGASRGCRVGITFPFRCRRQVRTRFLDAQLELPDSADAIGLGLCLRHGARAIEIAQAARERVALEFSSARLTHQLGEPRIVSKRILDAADRCAGFDLGARRGNSRSGNPVDRRADHGDASIDDRVAAYPYDQLLVDGQQACGEQCCAKGKLPDPPPRERRLAGFGQISGAWSPDIGFGCRGHVRASQIR